MTWGLRAFRKAFCGCLNRRADTLFELAGAILTAGTVPSLPHLSLALIHCRGWGSLYAALDRGRIDAEALWDLLAGLPLAEDPGRARFYAKLESTYWRRSTTATARSSEVKLEAET
jgi:hypothetical protein